MVFSVIGYGHNCIVNGFQCYRQVFATKSWQTFGGGTENTMEFILSVIGLVCGKSFTGNPVYLCICHGQNPGFR